MRSQIPVHLPLNLPVRERLLPLLTAKRARIGVVGLGYVGLPLAREFAHAGFDTLGFDVDQSRIEAVNAGRFASTGEVGHVQQLLKSSLRATFAMEHLSGCDCIIICVPTPLTTADEPDVSHILSAVETIKKHLTDGQLIVLESTTYPGTTEELLLPLLRATGLELDDNFLLAFSPERIDPGNLNFGTSNIPKIVGGCSPHSTEVAAAMYGQIVNEVYPVSSTRIAETTKLLENTFRAVNIGLANEMAQLCHKLNIDVWEVIDAAKTKPFGFMPFYPGPGLGGHCIPLDPQYLSWKGRQFGFESRFIGVAHEVNAQMPQHVLSIIADALNQRGVPLNGANILVLGVAYKKNIGDARESPACDVIRLLREKRAHVTYHDPFVPLLRFDASHAKQSRTSVFRGAERRQDDRQTSDRTNRRFDALRSVPLDGRRLADSDCVVITTDHDDVDYRAVVDCAPLIVDTRNVLGPELRGRARGTVVRL